MTDKGFGILAYQTTGNYSTGGAKGTFMDNVHTTWNATGGSGSGVWEYSPLKFWPGNSTDKLSFFAYCPVCKYARYKWYHIGECYELYRSTSDL